MKSWKFEARPIDDMIRTDPLSIHVNFSKISGRIFRVHCEKIRSSDNSPMANGRPTKPVLRIKFYVPEYLHEKSCRVASEVPSVETDRSSLSDVSSQGMIIRIEDFNDK